MRILHLSDFHFAKDTQWEASDVLKGLVHRLDKLAQGGLADVLGE